MLGAPGNKLLSKLEPLLIDFREVARPCLLSTSLVSWLLYRPR